MICTIDLFLGSLPEAEKLDLFPLAEPLVKKWKELEPLNHATINRIFKAQTGIDIEFNSTY